MRVDVQDIMLAFRTILPDMDITAETVLHWTMEEREAALRWVNMLHGVMQGRPHCVRKLRCR